MPTRLENVTVDAEHPAELARFWSELLSWPIALEDDDEVDVRGDDDFDGELVFVPVPGPKKAKNRVHLDLRSDSLEHQHEIVEHAVELGARPADIGQGKVPWVVLHDPEGNEFCVLEPREVYRDTGKLAAVVLDAREPLPLARFWSAASGWPVVDGDTRYPALRDPSGRGPFLEFVPNTEDKRTKNRVHLDVRPYARDDLNEEVRRLVELGAQHADIGQRDVPWVVLRDPEGNEFCVLTPR